jgi:hypothetical protein|tara:strand:+ start:5173 stop:5868 length:696 start_codon:yes stop_codon:yes gene_type:complete
MGLFSGIGKMIGGFAKRAAAKRAQRAARKAKEDATGKLNSLENSRQNLVNPYDNVKDLSALASDLSGKLSNPFASLGVATGAAEMQNEQTDVALANTLDTIRATGGGAGGATALAQAALQSKKGVSASIESQEASNAKLKAQGQQQLERATLEEGKRIQNTEINEGAREQNAMARGRAFKFNATETRQNNKINYTRQVRDRAERRELGAAQQKANAVGDIAGGIGGALDGI